MKNGFFKLKAWVLRTYGALYVHVTGWTEEDEFSAVDLDKAVELYHQGATFIDVRTPHEWARGSVFRAMFARNGLMENIEPKPASSDALVTFCEAGDRARRAAIRLRKEGYSNVYFLCPGGYSNWAVAGLPVAA